MSGRTEHVPGLSGGAIWQSERACAYQCPVCGSWIFSQHEGTTIPPVVACHGPIDGHDLDWGAEENRKKNP